MEGASVFFAILTVVFMIVFTRIAMKGWLNRLMEGHGCIMRLLGLLIAIVIIFVVSVLLAFGITYVIFRGEFLK